MTRDTGRRQRRPLDTDPTGSRGTLRRFARTPSLEPLENRRLLSGFYTGPSTIRPVQAGGTIYTLQVNGGGFEKVKPIGHGLIGITLFATTPSSTLDITQTYQRPHYKNSLLQIAAIKVVSGQLGGINAGNSASLMGAISPLSGNVNTLQFASLGQNAQINVAGSLGTLGATGGIDLGPNGQVNIGGDLQQSLNVTGPVVLDGGLISIGNNLSGALNVGTLTLDHGGRFLVNHDVTGAATVSGDLVARNNGLLNIGHDLGGLTVAKGLTLDTGGHIAVGNDLTGAVNVGGALNISNKGLLSVGRDVSGTLTVTSDLSLKTAGSVTIGRDLNGMTVNGNLIVNGTGSTITVGGNLTNLTVQGLFQGTGSKTAADLSIGLNLGQLNVAGGAANQGGIQQANITVAKSILGINVPHGIFNSFIAAGVLIDGGTAPTGGNVGADGADAISNSEIRAGVQINHLTLGGNVRSTFPENLHSAGYPTRIIAGLDPQGVFTSGGSIDNFQITGALIDSVVAASAAAGGGDGSLPPSGYGPPRTCVLIPGATYDQPTGTVAIGTVGDNTPPNSKTVPNYSVVSYLNMTATGTSYGTPNPTLCILPGSINASFATAPIPQSALTGNTTVTTSTGGSTQPGTTTQVTVTPSAQQLPLPSKSAVLGGVISTTHGAEADYAGFFAADTRGVFVGTLPQ